MCMTHLNRSLALSLIYGHIRTVIIETAIHILEVSEYTFMLIGSLFQDYDLKAVAVPCDHHGMIGE